MNSVSKQKPASLLSFVDNLQSKGRYTFLKEDALKTLCITEGALKQSAMRLVKKGRLASPRNGFFVIVPTEYLSAGAPPPPWYIDNLMKFHKKPYYVCLLSAAALHGAAHQQPQEFQIVTDTPLRFVTVGRSRLHFFTKRRMESTPIQQIKTPTGYMNVSTPEATALDLMRYIRHVGFLNNAATVLVELSEKINGRKLLALAKAEKELAAIQRLGFLLEHIKQKELAKPLNDWLKTQSPSLISLRPDLSIKGAIRNQRWALAVNDSIEADL